MVKLNPLAFDRPDRKVSGDIDKGRLWQTNASSEPGASSFWPPLEIRLNWYILKHKEKLVSEIRMVPLFYIKEAANQMYLSPSLLKLSLK